MAWKQVRRFGVYLRDLDDVSRLWESEASVPRFNRSWKLDLKDEFGKGSRSPSSVEAVRVRRFAFLSLPPGWPSVVPVLAVSVFPGSNVCLSTLAFSGVPVPVVCVSCLSRGASHADVCRFPSVLADLSGVIQCLWTR